MMNKTIFHPNIMLSFSRMKIVQEKKIMAYNDERTFILGLSVPLSGVKVQDGLVTKKILH